jgi:hypothetical protein
MPSSTESRFERANRVLPSTRKGSEDRSGRHASDQVVRRGAHAPLPPEATGPKPRLVMQHRKLSIIESLGIIFLVQRWIQAILDVGELRYLGRMPKANIDVPSISF